MSRSSEITDPEQKLERALAALAEREEAYEKACCEFADAEYEYKTAFADAFKAAPGSAELRKETATAATRTELKKYLQAKQAAKMIQIKMENAQKAVSARQSLLSSARRMNEAL